MPIIPAGIAKYADDVIGVVSKENNASTSAIGSQVPPPVLKGLH